MACYHRDRNQGAGQIVDVALYEPILSLLARSEERLRYADELDAAVASWIGARTADDVVAGFEAARVPVSRVMDLVSLLGEPHVQARESIVHQHDPELGEWPCLRHNLA